jgi:leucyl/phenylalanyl-tRNA---protein transferase
MKSPDHDEKYPFPHPSTADEEGVVAVGGEFNAGRLLAAYRQGIFPWSGDPLRWYSPTPRGIIWQVKLPRRLPKMIRKGGFRITFDRAFQQVVQACSDSHRHEGEWITSDFVRAYTELHHEGYAHSVEVWNREGDLVGGLYGVHIAGLYAGESMFYREPNASKVAFAALVHHLKAIGVVLIDCQMVTEYTERLGAVWVWREDYLELLEQALAQESRYSGEIWPADGCFAD